MGAPGANVSYANPQRTFRYILKKIGLTSVVTSVARQTIAPGDTDTSFPRQIGVGVKAGVPATNTAADAPTGVGDLCYDSTNDDVYRCTAYTNTTTFTWSKIVD